MGTTRLATTSNWLHITKQSWKIPPSRTEDALLSMGLNTNSPNLWPTTVEFIFTYSHTTMTIFPHRAIQGFSLSTISSPFLTMLDRYTSDCMKSIHSIRNNIKEHTPLKMKLPVKYSYLIRNYEHSLLPICTQWPLFYWQATSSTLFLMTNSSYFSLTLAKCIGECKLSMQNINYCIKDPTQSKSNCNTSQKLIMAQVYKDSLIL